MSIAFDIAKTEQRKQALESYMNANVLHGKSFICTHFEQCKGSHKGIFYEGQLHHVGQYYDIAINDQPFRTIVVGQEYGHGPAKVSLADRSKMIIEQTGYQKTFATRNPHMRGTTSVLRLLLGIPLGPDYQSEFIQVDQNTKCHLFEAFALVNYLLCSAVDEDEGRRGKSTTTMKENCQNHFQSSLEILDPNVIVIQSKGYWQWIKKSFDVLIPLSNDLFKTDLNRHVVMVAVFTHPSTPDKQHNWGISEKTPYINDVVVPTVNRIRSELLGIKAEEQTQINSNITHSKQKSKNYSEERRNSMNTHTDNKYELFYNKMQARLEALLPKPIPVKRLKFEIKGNRMSIYIPGFPGSHYEICFRGSYHEIALHFQSTLNKNESRLAKFKPFQITLKNKLNQNIEIGRLENKDWRSVWIALPPQQFSDVLLEPYSDLLAKFMVETFPILQSAYRDEE